MTNNTNVVIDYTAIGNAAAEAENQQEMKEGGKGFERPTAEAGPALVRLQQYIELGVQKSNRSDFKDAQQVMFRFELHTPNHLFEIEVDGVTKKVPLTIDIRLPKGGSTSKYGRLFTALNYNGKFNHFAQMVGAGSWLAEITHNIVGEGDKKKTYANLDKNKAWTFTAPQKVDPMSKEVTVYPVGELSGDPKVFLFENKGIADDAYKALFDTLFIEGEHEAKGDKPAKSKNWIQDTITNSIKFSETRLASIINNNPEGVDVDALVAAAEQGAEPKVEAKPEPKVEATPAEVDPLLAALNA